jgi:hypothetical protein
MHTREKHTHKPDAFAARQLRLRSSLSRGSSCSCEAVKTLQFGMSGVFVMLQAATGGILHAQ